ncbi:MAG: hypothetical protein ACYSYV_01610 [Planctomycetota bacterium]|jgi:tRNA A-37 threonylcarbamoyl transferase component Bud32
MELVGNIARKTGSPSLLAVEALKAERAGQIGNSSGLFYVPEVVNFDAKAGVLEFERLSGLVTLLDLAVRKDKRLPGLLKKAGQALAVVHEKLVLPEEMKHELPSEWMDPLDENVFIHGDFACINAGLHEPSGELVIVDWSAAPLVGRTPTFGSRYFDILLFTSSMFHGAPYTRAVNWNARGKAGAFLTGYAKSLPGEKLNKLKEYLSNICRLQRKNIWHLAQQRRPLRAVGYISHQVLMHARFHLFLRRYES